MKRLMVKALKAKAREESGTQGLTAGDRVRVGKAGASRGRTGSQIGLVCRGGRGQPSIPSTAERSSSAMQGRFRAELQAQQKMEVKGGSYPEPTQSSGL